MNELLITSIKKEELSELIANSVRKVLNETHSVNNPLISQYNSNGNNPNEYMNIEEIALFINLAKATIYSLCSNARIPHIKKGKRLYFVKEDIVTWLNEGKRKTLDQIQVEAVNYLLKKGK